MGAAKDYCFQIESPDGVGSSEYRIRADTIEEYSQRHQVPVKLSLNGELVGGIAHARRVIAWWTEEVDDPPLLDE